MFSAWCLFLRLKGGSQQIVRCRRPSSQPAVPARGRVLARSRRPRLWSGTRPQPATLRPWAAAVPWPGARAQPTPQHHDWARLRKRSRCPTLHLRQRSPCPTAERMLYGEKRACCTFAQLWATSLARSRRGAFPGGDPWRLFRFMRSRRGLGREKRPFLAVYRRRASETSRLRQDMRAVHPKSPANGRSGMHGAKILPRRGPFRCAGPSNHARRADLAVVRLSPGAGLYA